MPLVRVVGGRSREEQIGTYQLAPASEGTLRSLKVGGPAVVVTGDELRKLAGVAQVEVLDEGPAATQPPVLFDATASTPVWGSAPDSLTTNETLSEAGEEEHSA